MVYLAHLSKNMMNNDKIVTIPEELYIISERSLIKAQTGAEEILMGCEDFTDLSARV